MIGRLLFFDFGVIIAIFVSWSSFLGFSDSLLVLADSVVSCSRLRCFGFFGFNMELCYLVLYDSMLCDILIRCFFLLFSRESYFLCLWVNLRVSLSM